MSHILTLPQANLWQCVSALGWPACWNSLLQHVRSHLDTAREEPREPQCCGVNLPHTHLTRHREVVEHSKKVWKLSENNNSSWASQTPPKLSLQRGKRPERKGDLWVLLAVPTAKAIHHLSAPETLPREPFGSLVFTPSPSPSPQALAMNQGQAASPRSFSSFSPTATTVTMF